MRLIPDQNEKVVVTRGYLTGMIAWPSMLVGMLTLETGSLPAWVGWTFSLVGLGAFVWAIPHLMTKPQPLDQDQREAKGRGTAG